MNAKGFIDILFILLLSAIVMLTDSVQLGGVEAAPAKVGVGGVAPIRADEIRIVAVRNETIVMEDREYDSVELLEHVLNPADPVLLVPGRPDVSHQRVMAVWSAFKESGRDIRLGVEPVESAAEDASEVAPQRSSRRGV